MSTEDEERERKIAEAIKRWEDRGGKVERKPPPKVITYYDFSSKKARKKLSGGKRANSGRPKKEDAPERTPEEPPPPVPPPRRKYRVGDVIAVPDYLQGRTLRATVASMDRRRVLVTFCGTTASAWVEEEWTQLVWRGVCE